MVWPPSRYAGVVSSRLRDSTASRAGVEQHETAGAVGRLGHARLETGLAEQRRLLVAGHSRDRDFGRRTSPAPVGRKVRLLSWTSGSSASGTPNSRHSSASQRSSWMSNSKVAAGVGDVGGVDRAAGQPPQQEAVDGPERQLAALGPLAGAGHIVEHPGDLGRGEIGVEEKPGPGADQRLGAVGLELGAAVGGAAVLPHDRAVDRLAGRAVPDDRGLALVGDADPGDARRHRLRFARALHARRRACRARCPPDRARPSRARG